MHSDTNIEGESCRQCERLEDQVEKLRGQLAERTMEYIKAADEVMRLRNQLGSAEPRAPDGPPSFGEPRGFA